MGDQPTKLGVAVSGGPDSLALLLLADAALPGRVEAATIDHGLRTESANEAAFVADLCQRLAVPHTIRTVQLERGNVQARAREVRYNALMSWASDRGLPTVATAHHADDQAETLLMRLNRGSGLMGLASVRPARPLSEAITLVRPLLAWRKEELEQICRDAGVTPIRDPSNEDADFDRVRIRQALAQSEWLDPVMLAKSAGLLAEASAVIEQQVYDAWQMDVSREGDGWIYAGPESYDSLVAIEVMAGILRELGVSSDRSKIHSAYDRLRFGDNASLGGVLIKAEKRPLPDNKVTEITVWKFAPEPPRNDG